MTAARPSVCCTSFFGCTPEITLEPVGLETTQRTGTRENPRLFTSTVALTT